MKQLCLFFVLGIILNFDVKVALDKNRDVVLLGRFDVDR